MQAIQTEPVSLTLSSPITLTIGCPYPHSRDHRNNGLIKTEMRFNMDFIMDADGYHIEPNELVLAHRVRTPDSAPLALNLITSKKYF